MSFAPASSTEVPGFIDYHAFEASAGVVASVSVFADRSGRDWAEERLGEWIEQTTSEFDISPGDVTEGRRSEAPVSAFRD